MESRSLKIIVIAIILVAIIGSAVAYLEFFNDHKNNESSDATRHYDEGDQIKSTIKWKDDSDVWHTGKYVFTVIDRGNHSLKANVMYTEGSNNLSQSIVISENNGTYTSTIEKFDGKIEFEPTNGKYTYLETYEIKDSDLLSRIFELTCNAFLSCSSGNTTIDPRTLFDDPDRMHEHILLYLRAYDGLYNLSEATYKDGQLHRSTIIVGSNIVCSEDPDLVKNFTGEGRCIEHVEFQLAGITWDCLKVTTMYDENTKQIRYYTSDGFLLLESQIGSTITHTLTSTSYN